MYHLYIDESGHVQKYDSTFQNPFHHRYFVLGGIVVGDEVKSRLECTISNIISDCFKEFTLPDSFKLSYHGLRRGQKYPYSRLEPSTRKAVADRVFGAMVSHDCILVSCQIDLDYVYKRYLQPVPQRDLALNFLTERFEYFLRENTSKGRIIHEYVTAKTNKQMQTSFGRLLQRYNLQTVVFEHIDPKITFARVRTEPILQFSDFFAYSVLIRARTEGAKQDRWKSISHKYFNLNHPNSFKRGNCSM